MHRRSIMTIAVAAGVLALLGKPTSAHHSGSMFEPEKTVTVKGVVTVFEYTNPHSWLWVRVKNDDQTTTDWGFEAEGPSTLFRAGIKKGDLKPGDEVTVTGRPLRDGRPAAALVNVITYDGRVLQPRPAPIATTPATSSASTPPGGN